MANSILWTYGCSFTQGMWEFDYRGDNVSDNQYHATDKGAPERRYIWGSEENWVDILCSKLEYRYKEPHQHIQIENRGKEGSGIIEVYDTMMKDTADWKSDDWIIIQLPLISRQFDTTELKRFREDGRDTQEMLRRWTEGIFNIMSNTNLQWFWWMTENPSHNLIGDIQPDRRLIFDNHNTYKDWMFSDHTLFYDSYVGDHCVDYHQNKEAHIRRAEFFYKQIRNR